MSNPNNSLILTSIHTLLERREWDRALELLIADPSVSMTIGSSYEALPLLVAVMNKPPLNLVQSLIAANPEAVTTRNVYGMIPLRTAIRSQASTEVIDAIIRA